MLCDQGHLDCKVSSYLVSARWLEANGFADCFGLRIVRHLHIIPEGGTFALIETLECFAAESIRLPADQVRVILAKWWIDEGRSQN
jgi:hypothetical protein